jgi:YebC/PmpR family DNA-binding regulatory protein
MSGHSKWHNIRLRKGAQDAKRGNLFTKLAKEIIMAAKNGGGNPDNNLRLRLSIQKARQYSMPADNIKRSIQRGTGEIEGAAFEELTYEGYGPAGVAVIVEVATDNKNRTVGVIRNLFTRNGGRLGETGSVASGPSASSLVRRTESMKTPCSVSRWRQAQRMCAPTTRTMRSWRSPKISRPCGRLWKRRN